MSSRCQGRQPSSQVKGGEDRYEATGVGDVAIRMDASVVPIRMDASVVIPTKDRPRALMRCLRALAEHQTSRRFEQSLSTMAARRRLGESSWRLLRVLG